MAITAGGLCGKFLSVLVFYFIGENQSMNVIIMANILSSLVSIFYVCKINNMILDTAWVDRVV